jgi:hypothetical protein
MGRAEIGSGQGSSRNGRRRYRSTEDIDPAELRQQVLLFLGQSAAPDLAARLEQTGYVTRLSGGCRGVPRAGCRWTRTGRSRRCCGHARPPMPPGR